MKELEQQLQFLSGKKHLTSQNQEANGETSPFSEFFSIPQYSTTITAAAAATTTSENVCCENEYYRNQQLPATADIEVTMVENHANLKIRSKKRPRLLPTIISGLESLRLTVLHLNVSKVDQFVLCSLSLKVRLHNVFITPTVPINVSQLKISKVNQIFKSFQFTSLNFEFQLSHI